MLRSRLLQLIRVMIKDDPPDGYTPRYSDEYLSLAIAEALFYIIPQLPSSEVYYITTLKQDQYCLPLPPYILQWDSTKLYKVDPVVNSHNPVTTLYALSLTDPNGNIYYPTYNYNLTSHIIQPTTTSRPSQFRIINGYIYFNTKSDKDYTLTLKGVGLICPYTNDDYDIPDVYIPLILRYVKYIILLDEFPPVAKLNFQAFQLLLDRFLGREPK